MAGWRAGGLAGCGLAGLRVAVWWIDGWGGDWLGFGLRGRGMIGAWRDRVWWAWGVTGLGCDVGSWHEGVTWCVTGRVAVTGRVTGCGHAWSQGSKIVGIKPFSTGCDRVWAPHVTQSHARSHPTSRCARHVTVCVLSHTPGHGPRPVTIARPVTLPVTSHAPRHDVHARSRRFPGPHPAWHVRSDVACDMAGYVAGR